MRPWAMSRAAPRPATADYKSIIAVAHHALGTAGSFLRGRSISADALEPRSRAPDVAAGAYPKIVMMGKQRRPLNNPPSQWRWNAGMVGDRVPRIRAS